LFRFSTQVIHFFLILRGSSQYFGYCYVQLTSSRFVL
jgi:hypothetical protein